MSNFVLMKLAKFIILFYFIGFSITPTLLSFLNNENIECCIFLEDETQENNEENNEEKNNENKEKPCFFNNHYKNIPFTELNSFILFSFKDKFICNYINNIFIPPPNFF